MNVSIVTALIAAWVPILGLFITNALERRRALRLRELEFRLGSIQGVLASTVRIWRQQDLRDAVALRQQPKCRRVDWKPKFA